MFVLGLFGAGLFAASMAAFAAFAKKFGDIMAERDPSTIVILPLALIG
jgi:hypothetical protein